MSDAPFDPSGAVSFDLASGRVNVKDSSSRVLVPAESLCALCEAAGEDATRSLGRAIGESVGRRALQGLVGAQTPNDRVNGVTLQRFVEFLAGEFAIAGLGTLGFERWGRAMLVMVDCSVPHAGLVGAVIEAALESSTGRSMRCVELANQGERKRYLVASASTAERVRGELAAGKAWAEVLVGLHAAESSDQARGEA